MADMTASPTTTPRSADDLISELLDEQKLLQAKINGLENSNSRLLQLLERKSRDYDDVMSLLRRLHDKFNAHQTAKPEGMCHEG